ncbi:MAG: formate dehydrogenase accessory sulfurtransferase FdhD [Pseudomonadota bacterium]|nr:formate dehydrogenase accessory sulfurtransferase FdhD [Pseudomonadota bacterium]
MNVTDFKTLKSVKRLEVERIGEGAGTLEDVVATEEPLEIRLAYTSPEGKRAEQSISVTMRTPGNDRELAAGFLYTEGIISKNADIESIAPCGPPAPNGLINVVRVELATDVEVALDRLERHFYTSSSCGVCGKSSLDAVAVQGHYDLHKIGLCVSAEKLGSLPSSLREQQAVFERTGGLHASGLFDAFGNITAVREDVGRHNALDKLIGQALLANSLPLTDFGIVVSGRASFELMQKAMMAGIPLLAAVGAPSSLAVELAEEFGMTLIGFLKKDKLNIYTRSDRIQ